MDAVLKDHPTQCPSLPKPRSFWQRIADRLAALLGAPRAATPPEKSVAFTIAVIALGAKLAKADGAVARSEVAAFRRVFIIPRAEEKNAARVFDLARQDVAADVLPQSRQVPAAELTADRGPLAEPFGQVARRRTGFCDPENTIQNKPMIRRLPSLRVSKGLNEALEEGPFSVGYQASPSPTSR